MYMSEKRSIKINIEGVTGRNIRVVGSTGLGGAESSVVVDGKETVLKDGETLTNDGGRIKVSRSFTGIDGEKPVLKFDNLVEKFKYYADFANAFDGDIPVWILDSKKKIVMSNLIFLLQTTKDRVDVVEYLRSGGFADGEVDIVTIEKLYRHVTAVSDLIRGWEEVRETYLY